MIELKAETVTTDGENRIEVGCELEGKGLTLVAESLSIIRCILNTLKEEDPLLYEMALLTMSADKSILRGDYEADEDASRKAEMSSLMSKAILKKGDLN